jgi:hypothetical protein
VGHGCATTASDLPDVTRGIFLIWGLDIDSVNQNSCTGLICRSLSACQARSFTKTGNCVMPPPSEGVRLRSRLTDYVPSRDICFAISTKGMSHQADLEASIAEADGAIGHGTV